MNKMIYSIFFMLSCSFLVFAQSNDKNYNYENDNIVKQKSKRELFKIQGVADEAVGVLDKGQLQNLTMNYGHITDTRFEDRGNAPTQSFFNFRYPRGNWTSLTDDFSLLFALPENSKNGNNGNVIDAYTENDNEDFIAKDGSYGLTHYNPATDPTPEAPLLYPPESPTTPYLAHSDLPLTWPADNSGERFWPGYFRRDPTTGAEMEGQFVSDREVYGVFTDANNQFGNSIGIEIEMMAYCYGRPYADKFQFYEFFIHNKSGKRLDSCYVGYYGDPDCSDYGEETFICPDPTFSDPNIPDILIQRDFDGDLNAATQPNNVGKVEDETFGMAILETPKNIGVTTYHYFQDTGPVDDKVLWPIISNNPTDADITKFAGSYFHGTNQNYDDNATLTVKQDLVFIIASGPFSMEPDEMVKSTIVVAVGDNDADFYAQIDQAMGMFELGFVGPAAPPAPTLQVTETNNDGQITLYWDNVSETTPDPFTGDIDFEGYRIYRSEDNGQTWGQEIRDGKGSLIGYVPVAQFDLENGVKGFDPRNPVSDLGDDTGLQHSFVDKSVKNGIYYSYTIVAYDKGDSLIYSLESSRGTAITDRNFVTITPGPDYTGKIPSEVEKFEHSLGNGKGDIIINIVDDVVIKDDIYEIYFEGEPATSFSLINSSFSDTIAFRLPMNVEDNPVVDGFQVSAKSEGRISGVKIITDGYGNDVQNGNVDSTGSWTVSIVDFQPAFTIESRSHDYEIRFTEAGAIAYSWGAPNTSTAAFQVNFEVWDVTEGINQMVNFEVQDNNDNQQWDEGESIFILQTPYSAPNIGDPLEAVFPDEFPYQLIIANTPTDTENIPPQVGDVIKIESYRSFSSGDQFTFNFSKVGFDSDMADLSEIRVVPNPYIVGAAWEELQNVHQIRFMYLPPECKINIYTVSGDKVKTIDHNNFTGVELLNLVNENNQALAFGVYVYVVTMPDGKTHIGKFAIIR
ncbi:MAG: hypothetical protein GY936_16505 [Ignavibacteriae bacterium]|nr:hypothetical protein [Ignavibacteriota bacterium]